MNVILTFLLVILGEYVQARHYSVLSFTLLTASYFHYY